MIFVKLEGPQTSKNRVVEWLGGVLGGSWGNLEASWVLLEPFWASWRDLWGILGGTWGILEGLWSLLEMFWGALGRVLGDSWEVWEASRDHLGSIF